MSVRASGIAPKGRVMKSNAATEKSDADSAAPSIRKGLVLAVMSLSTFLIFLDGTVVNTALPAIARDFSASNAALQWIVNGYSLILAGLLLAGGMIGDRFGRRGALMAGMLIFGAGAVGAALADSSTTLIVMRGVQGLGAAFALPATLSIITAVFPRGERARAIAVWTAVGSLGIVVGPALGGYLVDTIGWSAVFWLNIPVVALALVGLTVVPESRDSRGLPIDLGGAALATTGMLATVYAIMQGGERGWASPEILIAALAGVILLALFVLSQLRSDHPMLPLEYFKRKDITGSFIVLALLMGGMIGVFFFVTQFLQLVQDRSALVAGLALTPIAATMMIGTGIATKAAGRVGPRGLMMAATLVILVGMGVFSQIEVGSPYWVPVLGLMIFGLGAGIAMPTATDTIMAAVPVDDAGMGSALNDLSRELGFVVGIATLGSLVTNLYRSDIKPAIEALVPTDVAAKIGESLGSVGAQTAELPPAIAASVSEAANRSFVDALNVGYLAAAGFIVLALLVSARLMPKDLRALQAEAPEPQVSSPDRPRDGLTPAPAPVLELAE